MAWGLPLLAACASAPIPPIPRAARIDDLCARVECAPRADGGVHAADGRLMAGEKALTPQFAAIESFDVSLERREVVFSAKRAGNFDVGLVSLDGSDVHWIPEDPADEVDAQWAPRENKVSYVVRARAGDVVRTVHVPTAVQLSVVFPYARVRMLRWDRAAERYAVVVSSPDASERVESMRYGGEDRRTEVAPEVRLDVIPEPLGGALLMRPAALRYEERLPLVVWVSPEPLAWDDARGELMRRARLACASLAQPPGEAFWKAVEAVPWIDPASIYVVLDEAAPATPPPAAAVIIRPAAVSGVRRHGNEIQVAPAVVKSFAASWIRQQLKDRNGLR